MAEGTRLKDLSEHVSTLELKMHKLATDYQDRVKELTTKIREVSEVGQRHYETLQAEAIMRHELVLKDSASRHEELLRLLASQPSPSLPTENGPPGHYLHKDSYHAEQINPVKMEAKESKGKGILPIPPREMDPREEGKRNRGTTHAYIPYPKLEFPTFGGEDPRVWIENCEQYFEVYQIPHQQWLNIATMHMIGRARTWKQSYFVHKNEVGWAEFVASLYRRFTRTGERYLVREFSNLRQLDKVERYQERFEELRTQLLFHNPHLTEEHFISYYISGLKEDLVSFLDIAHPDTLEEAYEQAKLHERALSVINRKCKSNPKKFGGSYQAANLFKPQPSTSTPKFQPNNEQRGSGNPPPYNRSLIE